MVAIKSRPNGNTLTVRSNLLGGLMIIPVMSATTSNLGACVCLGDDGTFDGIM